MIAAVFHGVEKGIKLEEIPKPRVRDSQDVLIKVHRCGLCGTDLATLEGRNIVKSPLVLGHEVAGEVEEIGNGVKFIKPGDHVSIDPNISCGVCYCCRTNHLNLCPNMISLGEQIDGGYAEYLVAPESAVFKFPNDIPWDVIPLAEPLSDVVNGVSKVKIEPGETAVVYGAGPMGLLWLTLLKRSGAGTLVSVEPKEKRAQAAYKVGADIVIDPNKSDAVSEVWKVTGGRGADVAVEAIGRPDTIQNAIKSSAYGGRIVIMGITRPETTASFQPYELMRYERKIMGTFIANGKFNLAIEELSKGFIPTDVFITHKINIREIDRAFDLNRKGEAVKTLILPSA